MTRSRMPVQGKPFLEDLYQIGDPRNVPHSCLNVEGVITRKKSIESYGSDIDFLCQLAYVPDN